MIRIESPSKKYSGRTVINNGWGEPRYDWWGWFRRSLGRGGVVSEPVAEAPK
jgi:hypothetical protein